MSSYGAPPPPAGSYPQQQAPQQQAPQQQSWGQPQQQSQQQAPQQTPPYWPNNQTPPQHQGGSPQFSGQPQQQQPAGPVPYYQVDEQATAARAEEVGQSNFSGEQFPNYVKWPGDWATAYQGFESIVQGRLCSPWAPGKEPFVESVTHFYKSRSKPRGGIIRHVQNCKFCLSCDIARASSDPQAVAAANNWAKTRSQVLYNFINETEPNAHMYKDGVMRPLIMGASSQLHSDFKMLSKVRGGWSPLLVHPQGNPASRPLVCVKRKTGPEILNIEYQGFDKDPEPLNQWFAPCFDHLWDLEKLVSAAPSEEDVVKVLQEIGLPMPAMGHAQGQVPQSYSPNPAPPHANPYPQYPPQHPGAPAPAPQQYAAPPPMQQQQGWATQQAAPPPQQPAPQQQVPQLQYGAPPPAPAGGPQQAAPPPPPPNVTANPDPNAQQYTAPQGAPPPPMGGGNVPF